MRDTHWSSDVPVSLPEPVAKAEDGEIRISMGGFVFTENGLFHDIDEAMRDDLALPTFSPMPANTVVYEEDMDGKNSAEFI